MQGVMRTADALTPMPGLVYTLAAVVAVYAVLAVWGVYYLFAFWGGLGPGQALQDRLPLLEQPVQASGGTCGRDRARLGSSGLGERPQVEAGPAARRPLRAHRRLRFVAPLHRVAPTLAPGDGVSAPWRRQTVSTLEHQR